ncbi:MAG: SDR family NAD(P)-dependent oxidoreductase [Candidatus Omnitrophota bacterium]
MRDVFKGKRILITGGAGSVGRALTDRILDYNPRAIRILDISENEVAQMRSDLGKIKAKKVRYLIGDIRDSNRLKLAMENVDIVIHLAAMKHVYACEYNPFEAIKTNIDGLQNIIDVARHGNVKKVIFSSTDKAARPSNVMGMTKLLGEKLISLANFYKGNKRTIFASVRFGNVVGSNGSAVPIFKRQIQNGKPLTITDEKMTRFVITMDEATELICRAVELARGGETFVWKMRSLKVIDLARCMGSKYGKGRKVNMVTIGREKGEKLHEDIMDEEEVYRAAEMDDLYVVFPLIDHVNARRKYKNISRIKSPIIDSSQGKHMNDKQIKEFLERT